MSVRECAFKIFCDVMEKRNIEMTKTLCSRYVLWDLICASWCMWGIVIPKIFFILEWRKVWGSVHCGVSNGRNFKSLLQNESLYSSRGEFLSSKGSWKPGASLKYFGVRGTINVSETLLHCIAFIFFLLRNWKSTSQIIPLSICTAKVDPLHLFSQGVVVWNVQFSQETLFWKHTF